MKKLLFLIIIILSSCEDFLQLDDKVPNISEFTIKRGSHYYEINKKTPFRMQRSKIWHYKVLIDKNHKTIRLENDCNASWNKIGGIGPHLNNQNNSAMWVFRYVYSSFPSLRISPYTHNGNKIHKEKDLKYGTYKTLNGEKVLADSLGIKIDFEKVYNLYIKYTNDSVYYKFENQLVAVHKHPNSKENDFREFTPYFGGKCPYPGILQDSTFVDSAIIILGKAGQTTKDEIIQHYKQLKWKL